eukprot:6454993-Amphidinium_carterae.1
MHDPVAGTEAKHAPRGIDCYWLGRSDGSGEHLGAVASTGEVMRFRSLRRRAVADRHSPSLLRVSALPWKRTSPLLPESVVEETPQDERPHIHIAEPTVPRVPRVTVMRDDDWIAPSGVLAGEAGAAGYPSMAAANRAMRSALGPTPNCKACSLGGIWGHGKKHSAECRLKREAWLAEQR